MSECAMTTQSTRTNESEVLEVRMIIEFSRYESLIYKLDDIQYRYKLANKWPRLQ